MFRFFVVVFLSFRSTHNHYHFKESLAVVKQIYILKTICLRYRFNYKLLFVLIYFFHFTKSKTVRIWMTLCTRQNKWFISEEKCFLFFYNFFFFRKIRLNQTKFQNTGLIIFHCCYCSCLSRKIRWLRQMKTQLRHMRTRSPLFLNWMDGECGKPRLEAQPYKREKR